MNNLKRVLSLGLVGAMLSGMMIMGAGAATYTDVDDIENIEAVETMGSLNIINGKDNGSFDPEGFVTRAEMAKMIAVAMNGGKEPNFGVKANPTFTDTKGHWAETFIEYCYDMKIINGRGDGSFDPAGNVTGVEAAKMVLSALGYDSVAYILTGAEWDSNVNRLASQTCQPSLYDTVENVVMSQPINRDTAAQIIWNGMQNLVVEVNPDTAVSTGEVTNKYQQGKRTFLEVHYDAQIGYGILAGNDKTESGLTDGHIKLTNFFLENAATKDADGNDLSGSTPNFPWDTDLSLIGEKVKVIFKDGKQGSKGRPDKNDVIYGVYCANETEVVRDIVANVKDVESTDQVINIGGTEYDLADAVQVYDNYVKGTNYKKSVAKDLVATKVVNGKDVSWTQSNLTKALKATRGDTIKAVINDGKVDAIYVVRSELHYVSAVSSDKVTVNGVGTLKKADNDIYDGIAKDDMVVTTVLYAAKGNDKAYTIVEKAETVTGEVDKYKNNVNKSNEVLGNENITVDGTTYKVYDKLNFSVKNGNKFLDLVEDKNLGKEVELYMVNGYVAAAKLLSEDASNYSVITAHHSTSGGVGNIFDGLKIQVMGADGTKTILTVDEDSTDKDGKKLPKNATGTQAVKAFPLGAIVTYDVNRDGTATVYVKQVPSVAPNANSSVGSYSKDTKSVIANGKTYVTTADCILFVNNIEDGDSTYKAYNIRNLGAIDTATEVTVVTDKDNKAVAAYLQVKQTPTGVASSKVYGIVSASNGNVKIDGSYYRQFTISVNGEDYVVNQKAGAWDNADAAHKLAKGKIVGFEPTNDNIYEGRNDFTLVTDKGTQSEGTAYAVWVKEYNPDDGIITFYDNVTGPDDDGKYTGSKGSDTYAVDDDVKMYYVDTDADTALESGSVSTLNEMTGFKTAYLIVTGEEGKEKVVAIIAEVGGEAGIDA